MTAFLLGKNLEELTDIVADMRLPKFVAKQMADWLYKKRVTSFDEMTNLSKSVRQQLAQKYEIGRVTPLHEIVSDDGTKKYLFAADAGAVETVFIPEADRATVCVSSQVGCKMNCAFCMTGKQGFSGNLSVTEILNQIFSIPDSDKLTNAVFMGMGEPFDNFDAVMSALDVLTSEWGCAWSPRRITVSTVGLIPGIRRFVKESECHLAISLHHAFSEGRMAMMPVERAYSLPQLFAELRSADFRGQRRLSFEYIVFSGINDSVRHARELVRLLKDLHCRVNLIRFHAIPNAEYSSPSMEKMEWFRDYLNENGVVCTIRRSRGEDIAAACGLLSTKNKQ
ncbi:MAG: 23S rRNA (adenine(2503)-C(2))-methyltransferase RlmN [Paludibacteraceae bacterium]|nr:23S rRNA (adenine(2503)-C(2))-methyltransferase RlmN [Paludibacteraceae bacterium]